MESLGGGSTRIPAALRQAVAAIEQGRVGGVEQPVLTTDLQALDRSLPQRGFLFGTVHEVGGLSAAGFVLYLLSRVQGQILWVVPDNRREMLYGPGVQQAGVDIPRLAIAPCSTAEDLLWVAEEALKSGAAAAVVVQPLKPIDLTASRRLQLAAEIGGSLGFILTDPTKGPAAGVLFPDGVSDTLIPAAMAPSAVTTRWQIDPAPNGNADTLWVVRLLRVRGGGASGRFWTVRLNGSGTASLVGAEA